MIDYDETCHMTFTARMNPHSLQSPKSIRKRSIKPNIVMRFSFEMKLSYFENNGMNVNLDLSYSWYRYGR